LADAQQQLQHTDQQWQQQLNAARAEAREAQQQLERCLQQQSWELEQQSARAQESEQKCRSLQQQVLNLQQSLREVQLSSEVSWLNFANAAALCLHHRLAERCYGGLVHNAPASFHCV
jgi:hypothetical protein